MVGNDGYRDQIAQELLGKTGQFTAYFKLYDRLMMIGTDGHVVQIERPGQQGHHPLNHDDILTAARMLKSNNSLTLDDARQRLQSQLHVKRSRREIGFAISVAVQAMLMIDSDIEDYRGPDFRIGNHQHASWRAGETFSDFVARSFPKIPREHQHRVALALDDKKLMKAWKLKERLGISFKGTDNLADHLLFDPGNNILYLFHHAAYLRAHLDLWARDGACKEVDVSGSLKRGTLCPRLLAETLHSLQSILFCFYDSRSMDILETLIKKKSFDETCGVHEGYKMFADSREDFQYQYWGERLAIIHDLIHDRPPRNNFQRWIRWQTSESNAFFVALLALVISILVGLLSLGLSAFQAWIAWQAWKHPVQS